MVHEAVDLVRVASLVTSECDGLNRAVTRVRVERFEQEDADSIVNAVRHVPLSHSLTVLVGFSGRWHV